MTWCVGYDCTCAFVETAGLDSEICRASAKNQVVIFFESKSAAAANPCIEPPPEKNSEPEINETTNRNQTT
jgi:hypothetical protein